MRAFCHSKLFSCLMTLIIGAMLLLPASPGRASGLEQGMTDIASNLADLMSRQNFGKTSPILVYVSKPRNSNYHDACGPLSVLLSRNFTSALQARWQSIGLVKARVTTDYSSFAQDDGNKLIVNLTWRTKDNDTFDISLDVGETVGLNSTGFTSKSVEIDKSALTELEGRCLYSLDERSIELVASRRYKVFSSPKTGRHMAIIEKGSTYWLQGHIRGGGNWSLVEIGPDRPNATDGETVGFALLDKVGESAEDLRDQIKELVSDKAELRRSLDDANRRLNNAHKAADSKVADMQNQITAALNDARRLRDDLAIKDRLIDSLKTENARLRQAAQATPRYDPSPSGCNKSARIDKITGYDFDNTDFPQYDLVHHRKVSLEWCESECQSRCDCKYFTYNTRYRSCFLKSGVGKQVPFNTAISGRISGR